ncbi:FAD:protein FMN transferase [Sulfitobacter albidus]|uniref:FAD:protein FMN transferase n=1 Tax=Sulfitobacter albidus TaxID=2829501 RepID=UPI0020C8B4BB|nr:FAD:protein FMN transferase [Sulfitobacter albidus]
MNLSRRRFLSIAAASTLAPAAHAAPLRWHGRALGADVEISLRGARGMETRVLDEVRGALRRVEAAFNLYDPASELSRLNAAGRLQTPSPVFRTLLGRAAEIHKGTAGLFDPTVQPLWRALAEGRDPARARAALGWERVGMMPGVTLDAGQALTFNGIAQGFATDLVSGILARHGFTETLINIGEHRGRGAPWTLALNDPVHGTLGQRTLRDHAIATSSPAATPLAGAGTSCTGCAPLAGQASASRRAMRPRRTAMQPRWCWHRARK